mmetsp:Transcript_26715/g.44807  ORF Transcript_26715/g.44807 Transcript_26715/m.44807 type:complete len:227 (+) Transcript_26715:427-1107(+)
MRHCCHIPAIPANQLASSLSVTLEGQGVVPEPGGALGGTQLVGSVTLVLEATVLLAGGGEAAALAVLVHRVHDPVDASIRADRLVLHVNHDHLVVLVGGIVVHPVRVQHAQVAATASHTLLSHALEVAGELELGDTLVAGLTVHDTLADGPLAATTADAHAVHDVPLLGLVSQATGLVGAAGLVHAVDARELTELPAAHAQKEAEHIALLLLPQLLDVLVSSHDER